MKGTPFHITCPMCNSTNCVVDAYLKESYITKQGVMPFPMITCSDCEHEWNPHLEIARDQALLAAEEEQRPEAEKSRMITLFGGCKTPEYYAELERQRANKGETSNAESNRIESTGHDQS
jgi:hypothetical protein